MPLDPISADIDVINLALVRLGHETIADPDENSPAADLARATYDAIRRDELSLHPWNFATKWVTLGSQPVPPAAANQYDRAFTVPNDTLRILWCDGQSADAGDEWTISEGLLLTNLGGDELNVRYIRNHTNVPQWSDSFVNALASRLQQDWAENLVKETTVTERAAANYQNVRNRAQYQDSAQGTPRAIEAFSWIKVR